MEQTSYSASDVQRHAATATSMAQEQEISEENSTHTAFLNQKGDSQLNLSSESSSTKLPKLPAQRCEKLETIEAERAAACRERQVVEEAEEEYGDSSDGVVQVPLQASEPPPPEHQLKDNGETDDCPIFFQEQEKSIEESGPPGTLSDIVRSTGDDQGPVSKQWVTEQLQQMKKEFEAKIELMRLENENKTEQLKKRERELISCQEKIKDLEERLKCDSEEKEKLNEELETQRAIRDKLEDKVKSLEDEVKCLEEKLAEEKKRAESSESECARNREIMKTWDRIESKQDKQIELLKKNHCEQMIAHQQTKQTVEGVHVALSTNNQEQITPSHTSSVLSSLSPSNTSSCGSHGDDVVSKHKFERHLVESSVDPDK